MNSLVLRITRRAQFGLIPLAMGGLVLAAVLAWVLGGYFGFDIHALISYYSSEAPGSVVNVVVGDRLFGVHTFGDYLLAYDYSTSGNPWINSISASNNYPPVAMGIFWVLSLVPYKFGLFLYLLIAFTSLLFPIVNELRRHKAFTEYGFLLVPSILSVGVITSMDRGNYVALLITPTYLFFRMIKEEKWGKSTLLLALLISLKVYPVLLLFLYLRKGQFLRIFQVIAYGAAGSLLVTSLFPGNLMINVKAIVNGIRGYHSIGPIGLDPGNTSLFGALSRLLAKFPGLNTEYQFITSHMWWVGIFYLFLVVVTLGVGTVPNDISLYLLVSTLWTVAPLSFHYATSFLLVPLALSIGRSEPRSSPFLYSLTTFSILATLLPIVVPIAHGNENVMRSISTFSWLVLAIASFSISIHNYLKDNDDKSPGHSLRSRLIIKINSITG